MKVHTLRASQVISASVPEVWDFFSSPENLKTITPQKLSFNLISPKEDGIYPGQIIEYKIRPLLNIPIYWMTEITHVDHQKYFVDEQRYGPYAMWHHKHYFSPVEEGVLMIDVVHYKMPLFLLGLIANKFFVKSQLNEIFTYRHKKIAEIFGQDNNIRQPDIQFT